jgi:hypothetical protein
MEWHVQSWMLPRSVHALDAEAVTSESSVTQEFEKEIPD